MRNISEKNVDLIKVPLVICNDGIMYQDNAVGKKVDYLPTKTLPWYVTDKKE